MSLVSFNFNRSTVTDSLIRPHRRRPRRSQGDRPRSRARPPRAGEHQLPLVRPRSLPSLSNLKHVRAGTPSARRTRTRTRPCTSPTSCPSHPRTPRRPRLPSITSSPSPPRGTSRSISPRRTERWDSFSVMLRGGRLITDPLALHRLRSRSSLRHRRDALACTNCLKLHAKVTLNLLLVSGFCAATGMVASRLSARRPTLPPLSSGTRPAATPSRPL